ncbi:dipeptidyl aminopeptidase/acylaminoacyl peptidase [Spinactinospora alkalitolerans]|uniref:Dipeptidyl aminopeptidase/acylaminoacyl peptidase n=1 Tax=Spinactinospora alkalitolerans TaxID=687207 RepID=A0A852U998_9ACTN|nr:alpha/beta hydrolase [Spinactinospora alkalitolerans]NYE50520.1 dipeptidyl aminopeptidase/acylaminoacyl peptidase [Spinactinospora alkalitolerans]
MTETKPQGDALSIIELFPQHEDWSLQTMRLLAQVAVGGSDLFECARTAARIGSQTTDPEVWQREWSRTAKETAEAGHSALEAGDITTGRRALFRSMSYWRHSEFFLSSTDPRRDEAYIEGTRNFRKAAELTGGLIERISVPFEGQTMDGYVVRPDASGEKRPTVLMLGGADSWAEELYFLGGTEFPARGMNVVMVDTPGRGGSLRFKKMYSRHDYEVPVKAILDFLAERDDVEMDRLGLAGVSFGGYYAPRAAAFEPRVKAVAAWCGTWSILTDFYEYYPPLQQQLQWLSGSKDDAEAREKLARFTLDGVAEKLDIPVYVMHGENDIIMDIKGARRFEAALTVDDVTVDYYGGAGSLHCNYDYLAVAAARLADWMLHRI